MSDPVVLAVAAAAIAVILLALLFSRSERRSEQRRLQRRRDEAEARRAAEAEVRQQRERLCGMILATSSTGEIPGYAILRQVEAVFTDDHATPVEAVAALKAIAAAKGANALINLGTQRALNAKCQARGDAVVVRLLPGGGAEEPPPSPSMGSTE